jgi:hypothetical protein
MLPRPIRAFVLVAIVAVPLLGGCLSVKENATPSPAGQNATTTPPTQAGGNATAAGPGGQPASGQPANASGAARHVVIYVDNSARKDALVDLAFANHTVRAAVPYTGSQPNVKIAFDGNLTETSITLRATDASGATGTFPFPLDRDAWIVVSLTSDGRLDAWKLDAQPAFD